MKDISPQNYLKCIYHLQNISGAGVTTNEIAAAIGSKASSVSEMLARLEQNGLIDYQKYYGAKLTAAGTKKALTVVRKHRLWELFLAEKLGFRWDEVHDIAEQMEHIDSDELTNRLDAFLGHPQFDPHGDPIPDSRGRVKDSRKTMQASHLEKNDKALIVAVNETSTTFLRHLDKQNLKPGIRFRVKEKLEYDGSLLIVIGRNEKNISNQVAKNLLVTLQ